MNVIDLIDVTACGEKIPVEQLNIFLIQKETPVSAGKIFLSHFIDLSLIIASSLFVEIMIDLTMGHYLFTHSLRLAYENSSMPVASLFIFSTMFISYFFFSYLLNHGQTAGMYYSQIRVHMKPKSFRSSLCWSLYSLAVVVSLGTLIQKGKEWPKRYGMGSIESHDHLYQELIIEKGISPVNLVNQLLVDEHFLYTQEISSDTYKKSA